MKRMDVSCDLAELSQEYLKALRVFAAVAVATLPLPALATEIYYIHADHLDTPRLIENQSQQVVWRWDNDDPFGGNIANANPSGLGTFEFNLRFPGQYFDKETNLHYNYFRDYSPEIGRYIESDPIGLDGGLNTYAYAYNDSLRFKDPLGLDVRVCYYPSGVTHVGFGIVGESGTYGYYPRSRSPIAPGEIRPDPQNEPRECKEIPTNQDQDQCMLNCRTKRAENPGWYHLTKNQCTSYVRECMRECGIPTGVRPGLDSWQGPRPDRFYQALPGESRPVQ